MARRKSRARVTAEQPQTDDTESFGQRLARLRKARGFTQTELGEILSVSQRVITYYERESGRPPAHLLPHLADALKVSVDELVGYERLEEEHVPRNPRLWRKLRDIEKLAEPDRKAVLRFVDALLAKQRLDHQRG
jgi:transcriptional regulator with XRE-family HTH domain